MNDVWTSLERWYQSHCDGRWEHDHGVRIDTIDNPGWSVAIDLEGTKLESLSFTAVERMESPDEWLSCVVKDRQFIGHCGPEQLTEMIRIFVDFASVEISANHRTEK